MLKYSGKAITKAGEKFLDDTLVDNQKELEAAMDALSYWRLQHEAPLERAFIFLQENALTYDKKAIFAKRLKRFFSIVMKLHRFPKMNLKNMQDIGGCRVIVANQKKLYRIARTLRKKPAFRSQDGKIRYKDYISEPKNDGYRGYHLVGKFSDDQDNFRWIEVQLRTRLQHDWATALEIIDLFTGQALKSNQGEPDWEVFFAAISKHFALMEGIHLFDTKTDNEKLELYKKALKENTGFRVTGANIQNYARQLDVVHRLEGFANSLEIADSYISEKSVDGFVLLIVNTREGNVSTTLFEDSAIEDAEKMYIENEKKAAGDQKITVALVSTTAIGGIKEAYPNYFADSSDFLKHLILILKPRMHGTKAIHDRFN